MRSSTSPASSRGGRPDRPGARVSERFFVAEVFVAAVFVAEVFVAEVPALSFVFILQVPKPRLRPTCREANLSF
jgi:hypothetical protein